MIIKDESKGAFRVIVQPDGNVVSRRVADGVTVGAMGVTVPTEPPPPPPPSGAILPVTASLGDRFLRLPDGSPYDWRHVTGLGLYRLAIDDRWDELSAWLTALRSFGANSVRVALCVEGGPGDWWHDYATSWRNPLFYPTLVPFAQALEAHGFRLHACLIGAVDSFGVEPDWVHRSDVVTGNAPAQQLMREYVQQAVGTLYEHVRSFVIQITNEPFHNGFGDHSEPLLAELAGIAAEAAPGIPISLGDGGEWDGTGALPMSSFPATIHGHHPMRHHRRDYIVSLKRWVHHHNIDQTQMPVMFDEVWNMGWRGNESDSDGSTSTAGAFGVGVMTRLKRLCSGQFHMREGLKPMNQANGLSIAHPVKDETLACLRAWQRGLDSVPMGIVGSDCNADSCDRGPIERGQLPPFGDLDGDRHDGPIRVYGLLDTNHGGGYRGLSIAEPAGYDLRGSFRTVHLERHGNWQTRLIRA